MTTYINIGSANRQQAELRNTIDQLRLYVGKIADTKLVLDSICANNDYTKLASLLGITVEEAAQVYNLWTALAAQIKGATGLHQVLSRLG